MRLLENSWSEMLILDQIHQRMHNHLPDETTLANGQKFELLSLALLGVPSMSEAFNDLTTKLSTLKFDSADYVCLKFVLLLNPGADPSSYDSWPDVMTYFLFQMYGPLGIGATFKSVMNRSSARCTSTASIVTRVFR